MRQLVLQLQIVVAYCNGSTQAEIAAALGMHVQTVRARLHDAGVHVQVSRAALGPAEQEAVRRLHRQGQRARQLARRYGVAHTTVLRILKRNF